MRWTACIEGGPRRVNHAAVCIENRIFSFGGYCSTEEYKDWDPIPIYILDISTLRWTAIQYKKKRYIPFQRYGHTTVAYGHKVYMWGGRNNAIACDTLACFDTKTLKWSTPTVTGMQPLAKDGHSACVIRNYMYIFGGFEYYSEQYSQDVHSLDLDTMEWKHIIVHGTAPPYRDFHTAVAYNDRMYIYGGRGDLNNPYNSNEEMYCPEVYYFDTLFNTWVNVNANGRWPPARRSHSAWVHEDFMYIFGGMNATTKTHFNDMYRYSITENYWQRVKVRGVGPCKRRRQVCLINKDKLYLFGGTSPVLQKKRNREMDALGLSLNKVKLMDNSDLFILDYAPTLRTLGIICVIQNKLDQSLLPQDIINDITAMTKPNTISRPINQAGGIRRRR